jgi:hypothetical protein
MPDTETDSGENTWSVKDNACEGHPDAEGGSNGEK